MVLAADETHQEVVVMGKGVGFQAKLGQVIDDNKIQKVFVRQSQEDHLPELLEEISPEEIHLVNRLIDKAEEQLKQTFPANLFMTLADHMHFAIERARRGEFLTNPLAWNVKRLYKEEYRVSQEMVNMIEDEFQLTFHDSEAASIALHLINASRMDMAMEDTYQVTQIMESVLKIIELQYGTQYDEDSISFSRFMTHLQYFAQRIVQNSPYEGKDDDFLYEQVSLSYPKAFASSNSIKDFIKQQYNYDIGKEEQVYLTIHIQRMTQV